MAASTIKIIGNANVLFGVVDIGGTTFGQVTDASIELTGDEEGVPDDAGNFQSYILSNDQYKITITTILPKNAVLPQRGDNLGVTALNVGATILSWKRTGKAGKANTLEITAAHWVAIGGTIEAGPLVTTIPDSTVPNPARSEDGP